MIARESSAPSLVSQIAMRSLITSPPTTLPAVTSQPVPPPRRLLVPRPLVRGLVVPRSVPVSSVVPTHVLIVRAVAPAEQPVLPFLHCWNRPVLPCARFTPTGYFCMVDEV